MDKISKVAKNIVDEAYEEYSEVNRESLSEEKHREINKTDFNVTRKTFENIVKWAINGANYKDIARNLELTNQEFLMLCKVAPSLVWAMQKGQVLAELQIIGSAYDCAVGGKTYRKQVLATEMEYDEDGKPSRKKQYPVWIEYEKEPDPYLLKYFMENKLNENFGKLRNDVDKKRYDSIIGGLNEDEKKEFANKLRSELIIELDGKDKNKDE